MRSGISDDCHASAIGHSTPTRREQSYSSGSLSVARWHQARNSSMPTVRLLSDRANVIRRIQYPCRHVPAMVDVASVPDRWGVVADAEMDEDHLTSMTMTDSTGVFHTE